MINYLLFDELYEEPIPVIGKKGGIYTLHTGYKKNGEWQYVLCQPSPCKTKCYFSSEEIGVLIFDRESELLLAQNKEVEPIVLLHLTRAIKAWKTDFPHV